MGFFDHIMKAFSARAPSTKESAADDVDEEAGDDGIAVPEGNKPPESSSSADSIPTERELIRKITDQKLRPRAFQALWDGDTQGWGLRLQVVHRAGATHTSVELAFLRFGGDIRLFTGQVPPWPEAKVAAELGNALAQHYRVPFFFPSPQEPDDGCPNWWEQDKAIHCEDCDKLIIPTDSPYLPKEVCYHCHLKRVADEEIRKDVPSSPNGVKILVGKGDEYKQLVYSDNPKNLSIVEFALHGLARAAEADKTGQIVIEGADLGLLEAHLDTTVKALLQDYKPNTAFEGFPRPEAKRKITYDGRTLELDLQFDSTAAEIFNLISSIEIVKRVSEEHLKFWLIFRRGMTRRGDRVIGTLKRNNAIATVQQIADECRDLLDEEAVRAAILRLEGLGHVRCNGDEVRLTKTGEYL